MENVEFIEAGTGLRPNPSIGVINFKCFVPQPTMNLGLLVELYLRHWMEVNRQLTA
jgi:hypothetical protein